MYPVSARFLDALSGTHEAICRARALPRTWVGARAPFGLDPAGIEVEVIGGDVRMTRTGAIKRSLTIDVPGTWWELLQPYSVELYVERGIDFGDGTREWVPLGYYRVERVEQPEAPDGPLRVTAYDRAASAIQNRVLHPFQFAASVTHRFAFERIINGNTGEGQSTEGYGMFIYTPVPIRWAPVSAGGYDPDTTTVDGGQVIEDNSYAFLEQLADEQGCTLRFTEAGELSVEPIDGPPGATPVAEVRPGAGGNLVRASRSVTREGVYNIVIAWGSDPAARTGRQIEYISSGPLQWDAPFGAAPRYYASPLLRTNAEAEAAARTLVDRYVGLPQSLQLDIVPNPALRPADLITVQLRGDGEVFVHQIDEYTLPLTGTAAATITTRTHVVEELL